MSDSTLHLQPDALFVVACPICQGQVAATGSLCGRDACCPLCANLFHVPFPPAAAAAAARDQAAPPPASSRPPTLGDDWGGVIEKLAPPQGEPQAAERPAAEPERFALPDAAPVSAATAPPPAGQELLPTVGGTPLTPPADDLAFQEPVRTVRIGGQVIEIRRLSPEERRARRIRRNLVMIVVGVSILMAIVVLATLR